MSPSEKFTILIVDDEEGLRKNFQMHFELDGYRSLTAKGGLEALEILKSQRIDFVISDVRMPDGDGEMLLRAIKENKAEIPVVVMVTGFAELTKEEAMRIGAVDLLTKPIDFDLLEQYIKEAHARQRG